MYMVQSLGFVNYDDQNVFSKRYEKAECVITIDFSKKIINYPEQITINRHTTTNFSASENFVVFECIDRLLSMGYKPEHIELEPEWKLGHTQKGGYADIWVRTFRELSSDKIDKESLLIIECKKIDEFDGAWKDTLEDGAQLFSYYQQEQGTKFLCLYTSDWDGEMVSNDYFLINVQDNEEFLKNNPEAKSYKDANNSKQLFYVWHETYGCDASKRGVFERDIQPYHIGKKRFTVADLMPITNEEIKKKYNEFATILRQHNVGAKENAFDKLVNLFLAKVVDETNNSNDLHFYWKGAAYDDDFSLQDRLQRLYRDGMERFLNEPVTYIENEQIEKAFRWYKRDPDATMKTVMEYFRALKFYSDNDFSFISVHNARLFKENAIILRKVLLMLENIKLKSADKDIQTNQFLGDLFEGFLTKGVKQSEGQYFTPMPIVRFIVSSLPLEQIIKESKEIPSCIDYACGAGHFLTEYAVRIREFVEKYHPEVDIHEYYKRITGIEKEYRLSKVSKVSAFMYGHDETNIVYADALQRNDNLQSNSYDVLIANPPYAVTGFLETLAEKDREVYRLFDDKINLSKNNAIETFFIERSAQLMKSGGVAGIVLPVSVLNKGGIYTKARQIILENFDIQALVEFGSGTFGKTGTNTVVLFLRRKETNTPVYEHYRMRVNTWFSTSDNADEIYQDEILIQDYCDHCNYNINDYRIFLKDNIINIPLIETEIFCNYREAFESTSRTAMKGVCEEAKNVRSKFLSHAKTRVFKALSASQKQQEKDMAFFDFCRAIEKEKVYIYILAATVEHPVLIIKSPTVTTEIKKFLGYEWSDSKGNEGIQYLNVTSHKTENSEESDEDDTILQIRGINEINTVLFNPSNLFDSNKINSLIRNNFEGLDFEIPEDLSEYISIENLCDLIDFSRSSFDKSIKTVVSKKKLIAIKEYDNRDDLRPLRKVAPITSDRIPFGAFDDKKYITTDNMLQNFEGVVNYVGPAIDGNVVKYQSGDVLISNIRPYLKKVWLANCDGGCNPDVLVLHPQEDIMPEYLICILQRQIFIDYVMSDKRGVKMPRGDKHNIEQYPIPVPSKDTQKKIVKEWKDIDSKSIEARQVISQAMATIDSIYDKSSQEADNLLNLDNSRIFNLSIGRRIVSNEIVKDGNYKVVSANVNDEFGRINHSILDNFTVPSVLWGIDGDWMVNYIDKEIPFAPTDHCGVVRVLDEEKVLPKYLVYSLFKAGEQARFSRANRASTERVRALSIQVPDIRIQRRVVEKVIECEKQITNARRIIEEAPVKKQDMLDRYLK
uniref:site-specific DNA-methyltransferase (adenine-specific) n=1 Tax=Prevotella sp. GTC17260 TaxID=3236796 RepID=A0AB33JHX9_9BACT